MTVLRNLIFLFCTLSVLAVQAQTPADWVDPFIGTTGGGNTFPGATLPFGMVKLGPDCQSVANSGYTQGEAIKGFSHLHVSGTGGGPKYGNVLLMPFTGAFTRIDQSANASELIAQPGYFAADFKQKGIKAEMAVTHSAAMHRYRFTAGSRPGLLIHAGHFLSWPQVPYESQHLVGSEIEIISPTEIRGYNRVRGGWNIGDAYTVFFHVQLSAPASNWGSFRDSLIESEKKLQVDMGKGTGAYLQFEKLEANELQCKVGISFISSHKAKQNLLNEIPHWQLETVRTAAKEKWNRLLSKIEVEGGTAAQKKLLYTSLYFTLLMPSNRTGENPKWHSDAPYFDDFYTIWDTFRATQPLRTLLFPSVETALANSLLDIYQHEGYLPDGRSGNSSGRIQGGTNADVLFADWYSKGISGINYRLAYEAMKKNAEIPTGGDEQKEGRGGLLEYKRLGYVPVAYEPDQTVFLPPIYGLYERGGSRTLEYAHCDYALSVLAKTFGTNEEQRRYRQRAGNWKNLWKDTSFSGARGFIWPRRADGSWINDFSPLKDGSWGNFFYESTSWEYSFFVPHDVQALIDACGGATAFESRLDSFFTRGYFNIANEPGFLVPCWYNYIGRQYKTAALVRQILTQKYRDAPDGLPGNDDSGSMTAWFALHSIGFFPVAGQDVYLVSSPLFSKITLHLENGKTFVVEALQQSEQNKYIQSATLNGKPLRQAWFRHSSIGEGGHLQLQMGAQPALWDIGSPPPSTSTQTN